MANDKTRLDDFNFDDMSFDDIDQGSERRNNDDSAKKLSRLATSFAGGAKEAFVQPAMIRRLATNALPKGYGTAVNVGHETYRGAADLYNIAASELRPALPIIRRATARVLPKVRSHLPKKFAERLEEFSKRSDASRSYRASQEEMDESQIAAEMAAIVQTQLEAGAEQHAVDTAERRLREEIGDRRERVMAQRVMSIQSSMSRLVAYQDQITARFQQKSLELGYRQYFAMRDMLRLQMQNSHRDRDFMERQLKLAAMSEQEKLSMQDRAGGSFKDRLVAGVQSQASQYVGKFTQQLSKNLQNAVRSGMRGVADGIMSGDQMREGYQMAEEMGVDSESEGARAAGSMSMEAAMHLFGNALGKPFRDKFNPNGKVSQFGAWIDNLVNNGKLKANKFAKNDDGDQSIWGDLKRMAKMIVPIMSVDTKLGSSPILNADDPATFDGLTRRSIVEIIPGYLSRIHHELAKTRTGNPKLARMTYNLDRGEFTSVGKAASDIKKRVFDAGKLSSARGSVNTLVDMIDSDKTLSEATRQKFIRQLMTDSLSGEALDIERYFSADSDARELTADSKEELEKVLKKTLVMANGKIDQVKFSEILSKYNGLQSTVGNPMPAMSVYHEAGQKDILKRAKLVTGGRVTHMDLSAALDYITTADIGEGVGDSAQARTAQSAGEAVGNAILNGLSGMGGRFTERVSAMADTASGAMGSAVDAVGGLNGGGVKSTFAGLKATVTAGLGSAASHAKRLYDVYVNGRVQPVLTAAKIKLGEYRDQLTGDPIKTMDDIKGPVIDRFGRVVLAAEDVVEGLCDTTGRRLDDVADRIKERIEVLHTAHQQQRAAVSGTAQDKPEAAVAAAAATEATAAASGELVNLGTQQVQLLMAIYDVLSNRNFAEGVTMVGAPKSWTRQTFDKIGGVAKFGWKGVKGLGSAYMGYLKFLGRGARGLVSGAASIITGRAGQLASSAISMLSGVKDVYVTGETSPRLKAWKIKSEHYVDVNTKKKVKKLKSITGPVYDLKEAKEVISQEEFDKGLFVQGPSGLVRLGLKAIGSAVTTILGGYLSMAKLPFMAISAGVRGLSTGLQMAFSDRIDVYVSSDMKTPRLRAILMEQGKYYLSTNHAIVRGFKDIKGPVKELTGMSKKPSPQDKEVISEADIKQGLCDSKGRALKTPAQRILGFAGAAVGVAAKFAGGIAKAYTTVVGGAFKLAGNILGGTMKGIGRFFNPKFGTAAVPAPERTFNVLVAIHDMLDSRLPGKAMRKGSWAEQMLNRKSRTEAAQAAKEASSGGVMGKFFKMLKGGLFGGGGEEEEEEGDDGDTTVIAGGGGGGGGKANERDEKGRKRGGMRRNMASRWQRGKRWVGRSKVGRLLGAAGGAIGGVASKIPGRGLLSRFKPRGFGVGGVAAGVAAGVGGGYLVDKLGGDKTSAGQVAGGALKYGGYGLTALSLANWLGLSGGITAGGVASAVGGGLAALGTGALAILSSPITLTAAAIAAVGAAGYYGYKYYQNRKNAPLRKLRMAQYGIDVSNIDQMSKVMRLESKLMDAVVYGKEGAHLDAKKIKTEELFSAMGLDGGMIGGPSPEEKTRQGKLLAWIAARFKPVFLTHVTVLNGLDPKAELDDVDDDLKADAKLKYLNGVRTNPANYNFGDSPFEDAIVTGAAPVEAAYAEALQSVKAEIAKDAKSSDKQAAVAGAVAAGGVAGAIKAGGANASGPKAVQGRPGIPSAAKAAAAGLGAGGVAGAIKGQAGPKGVQLGGSLTALQAIRYRAYGLSDLPPDKVQTLAMLEEAALEFIDIDANKTATFNGNARDLYNEFSSRFGEGTPSLVGFHPWRGWFTDRFMPVLLAYVSAVRRNNSNGSLSKPEQSLKPEQLVDVGTAMIAAKRSVLGMSFSIWSYMTSPWHFDDYKLNTDSKSTYVSMLALKGAVRKQVVSEPTVDGKKAAVDKKKAELDADVSGGAKPQSFFSKIGNMFSNANATIAQGVRDVAQGAWDATKSGASAVAGAVSSGAHATSNFFAGAGAATKSAALAAGKSIAGLNLNALWEKVSPLIASGESMGGKYDAQNGVPSNITPGLSAMTIGAVHGLSGSIGRSDGKGPKTGAAGKYQFIPSTLLIAMKKAGLKLTDMFSPENQEKMARCMFDYRVGLGVKGGAVGILDQLAMEWASLPSPSRGGASWYAGDSAGNRAHGGAKRLEELFAAVNATTTGAGNESDSVAAATPATGATGMTTTTTANGATGGLGPMMGAMPSMVATSNGPAANEASFVKLPNYAATPVPSIDRSAGLQLAATSGTEAAEPILAQQRKVAADAAQAANLRGQEANAASSQQSTAVVNLLGQQLKVQQSMDGKLSRVIEQLSGISNKAQAAAPTTTTASAASTGDKSGPVIRGKRPMEAVTQSAPVDVRRAS